MNSQVKYVEISENQQGQRLDNFLLTQLKGVPKIHIYRLIRKGEVRVNKKRAKQTTRLELGDVVRIPPVRMREKQAFHHDSAKYAYLNDCVLYEDNAVLVMNKPAGLAVHAGSGIQVGLIEALRALRTDMPFLELAHRLDRETSGCVILAKSRAVLRALNQSFDASHQRARVTRKQYLCLVQGVWRFGERTVDKALDTQARRQGERHVIVSANGQSAKTRFKPIQTLEHATLLQATLFSGRTHQIRVHAMSENHPIAGDVRYGARDFNHTMRKLGLKRLFLHASRLVMPHPVSGEKMQWDAPLSEDLRMLLSTLTKNENVT